ncbi:hypothetical protein DTL42_16710 [Bremerella cremea]|uniref:Uncharacterized protein n=2 Tax=Bremerella cremea TaxID=1031537 RepID=A0A368KNV2_9BACT|nr:hypothetical protein DTL42_16710 [Bremerella cremea]
MFVIMVIGVLAWSHWLTSWRLFDLQQRFQKEQGLQIDDELKIVVFGEETFVLQSWQWKVYLPPGNYAIQANFVSVPRTGFPDNHILSTGGLGGGRVYTVHVAIRPASDGTWQLRLIADYGHGKLSDLDYVKPQPGIERIGEAIAYRGVGTHPNQTRKFASDKKVVLLHYRLDKSVPIDDQRNRNRKVPPPEEGLGVMAWITSVPPPPVDKTRDANSPVIDMTSSPTYLRHLQKKQAEAENKTKL